jgi:hypothetical protein
MALPSDTMLIGVSGKVNAAGTVPLLFCITKAKDSGKEVRGRLSGLTNLNPSLS